LSKSFITKDYLDNYKNKKCTPKSVLRWEFASVYNTQDYRVKRLFPPQCRFSVKAELVIQH